MAENNVTFTTGDLSTSTKVLDKSPGQIIFSVDKNNNGAIYYDKDDKNRVLMGPNIVYSENEPTNPAEGMIWLKPLAP